MSWDSPGFEESRARRVWLVSPALATVLFFVAQFFLAHYTERPHGVHGAATDTPSAVPVHVRVVAQIKSAQDVKAAAVPTSEDALLALLKKRGTVVFSSNEVENIGTQSSEFDDTEVGVITAGRRATFKR